MAALHEGPFDATVSHETLDVAGIAVDTVIARPGGPATGALVLVPDIMGLRPLFEDLCRRLATHGLAVRAIEPFAEIPATERATLDIPARMERVQHLDDDRIRAWASAAADRAERDAGGATRASVMGFCMGGYFTLKLAASGRFGRAVPFYGMIRTPERWRGARLRDPLDDARAMCPTLAIFGGKDPWTPLEEIEALRTAWSGRLGHEIVLYPDAEHGFVHDPARPSHRADDAADAWGHVLAFLAAGQR